jgi:hypothetical protein
MTRFLSLALADLECGGVNRETERLFTYHHGTKHSYRAVRRHKCAIIDVPRLLLFRNLSIYLRGS